MMVLQSCDSGGTGEVLGISEFGVIVHRRLAFSL